MTKGLLKTLEFEILDGAFEICGTGHIAWDWSTTDQVSSKLSRVQYGIRLDRTQSAVGQTIRLCINRNHQFGENFIPQFLVTVALSESR